MKKKYRDNLRRERDRYWVSKKKKIKKIKKKENNHNNNIKK